MKIMGPSTHATTTGSWRPNQERFGVGMCWISFRYTQSLLEHVRDKVKKQLFPRVRCLPSCNKQRQGAGHMFRAVLEAYTVNGAVYLVKELK